MRYLGVVVRTTNGVAEWLGLEGRLEEFAVVITKVVAEVDGTNLKGNS